MNNKMQKFKGRAATQAVLQQAEDSAHLVAAVQDLSVTTYGLLQRLDVVTNMAKRATDKSTDTLYRLLAMANLLGLSSEKINEEANRLQQEALDAANMALDAQEGLTPSSEPAKAGDAAVINIQLYLQGKALTDDSLTRTRIRLGQGELIPEVDQAVFGMSVQDVKRVSVDIQGKADEMEITLVGLSKAAKTETQSEEQSG